MNKALYFQSHISWLSKDTNDQNKQSFDYAL